MNSETRNCKNCSQAFIIEPDDFSFYEKMQVPAPAICPDCRFRRRAPFRNEISLYSRKCGLCGKALVSCYNPKTPYKIYCESCWESDKWDAYSFGKSYDDSRPFFEQLGELMQRVPKKATIISTSSKLGPNVRSEYTNYAGGNKDSYMIFNAGGNENVMYSRGTAFSRDTLDGYQGVQLERCYEVINVNESTAVQFGQNTVGSFDAAFVLNLSGCQDCFGCVNLRNKSHHFLNEPLPKDEYERRTGEIRGSYSKMEKFRKEFEAFSLKFPRRENSNLKSVGVEGDYLFESKNVRNSFETTRCEDGKFLFSVKLNRDSYDLIGFGYDSELLLGCVAAGYSNRVIGGFWVENCQNVEYSAQTRSSTWCLGCDGIKSGKYVILNQRYGEEEFHKLRDRIVKELKERDEYGLMMPPALSPFAYNESVGQEIWPLTRESAIAEGLRWEDDLQMTKGKGTLNAEKIPDHIDDVPDSIVSEVLTCTGCDRNYRITGAELQFYRKAILPIPRQCFYCRHADRIRRRGPMKLFDRNCDNCKKAIRTTYVPNRPEIVYCESCYQKEVI
ncbi:MAG: hypothetical protein AAB518_03655 [Patescibacteria group bacterium]